MGILQDYDDEFVNRVNDAPFEDSIKFRILKKELISIFDEFKHNYSQFGLKVIQNFKINIEQLMLCNEVECIKY